MIYSLDEVERPAEKIINNDDKMDEWYDWYRNGIVKRLKKYHKDLDSQHVEHDIPKPRRGFVFGGKKNDKNEN